jgi:hypothetical protein
MKISSAASKIETVLDRQPHGTEMRQEGDRQDKGTRASSTSSSLGFVYF